MFKVLVVDDEKVIVKGIRFALEQDGMQVEAAYNGEKAIELVHENEYDVVLLDLMLPKKSGMEVCREIREFSDVPIIMLTAKSDDMDKILGFEYGADDYITKPFNILEVKARIKATCRRVKSKKKSATTNDKRIIAKDLTLDIESRRAFVKGAEVNLTSKEFDLIVLFVTNPGKVYNRTQLLELIWGGGSNKERSVDVHIRRLREKLEENPATPKYILSKWGYGYFYKE